MASNKTYYLSFSILCVVSLLLSYGLCQVPSRYLQATHFWIPTLFFALTTLGINAVLTKGERHSKEFIFKTLALSMGRLLVSLVAVLIYAKVNKPESLPFACHFMLQYLIFTIFEIYYLLKYVKQAS